MHARVAAAQPEAEVVAVSAPTASRREPLARSLQVAEYDDPQRMFHEVPADCALIASPDALHVPQALAALQAGLHVFVEKPLGMCVEETRSVTELAKQRQLSLGVNFNRRYAFGYRRAHEMLRAGEIGRLRQMWLQVTDGVPPPHVAIRPDIIFWTLLGHHLDLVSFFGGEVRSVRAWLQSSRDDQLIDDLHLELELAEGGLATLSAAYRAGQLRTTERCELIGSSGSLIIDDVTCRLQKYSSDPDQVCVWRPNPFQAGNAFYDSLAQHLIDFIRRLSSGDSPAVDGSQALQATIIAAAAKQSQAEGGKVYL